MLGSRVEGSKFGAQGLRFRVESLGSRVQGSMVWGLGFTIQGFRVDDLRCKV